DGLPAPSGPAISGPTLAARGPVPILRAPNPGARRPNGPPTAPLTSGRATRSARPTARPSRRASPFHRRGVPLEQAVLGCPGRVHEADDPVDGPRRGVPALEVRQVLAVVVSGDDLAMAPAREEGEALPRLAAVPVGDDDIAGQALP